MMHQETSPVGISVRGQGGFTLVELSIAIIISGVTTVLIASLLNMNMVEKQRDTTEESAMFIESAISAYYVWNDGVYPCPSNITLPQSDPMYGVEQRDPVTGACILVPGFPAVNGRDVNGNGPIEDSEKVLIGGVPFKSMSGELVGTDVQWSKIRQKHIIDGWGKQFTYAVTKGLTVKATYDSDAGAIDIIDEMNRSLLDVPGSAHLAIISHGKNGRGGYDKDGRLAESCAGVTLPPPPSSLPAAMPSELSNCLHNDGVFLSGLRTETDFAYNDDVVHFLTLKETNLWKQTGPGITINDPTDPTKTIVIPQVRNANKGKVGIGMADPQKELDVFGDLLVRDIRTPVVCDSSEAACIPPDFIGGNVPDMQCGPGQVIDYIAGKPNPDPKYPGTTIPQVHCVDVTYSPTGIGADQDCPSGEHVVGITNFGRIVCKDVPLP